MTELLEGISTGTIVALVLAIALFTAGHVERILFHHMQFEIATWLFALLFLCAFIVGNEWLGYLRWIISACVLVTRGVLIYRYERRNRQKFF